MIASFCENNALPQLAWIAEVDRNTLAVKATFGSSVERGHDFLVAGVWNGPFGEGCFDASDCFFGTGIIVRDDAVTFVPSAALTDAIYYYDSDGRLLAANSLPLLLAASGDRLDPGFAFYDQIIESLQSGIDHYEKIVPTRQGKLFRVFVRNLKVTSASIVEVDKTWPPNFADFGSYFTYLADNYSKIYNNIRDPNRRHRLDIISTQSRGYDTTAINAVASKHQIDTVFTIVEPKETGAFVGTAPPSHDSDDGSEICAALGLTAVKLERRAFLRSFEDEHLFYATTNHAAAANFLGIKPHLRRVSVMLTGLVGDVVWANDLYYREHRELLAPLDEKERDPNGTSAVRPEMLTNDLRGPDTWLHGLSEISLEWGLIQLAPACIGDRNRPDIFQVTISEEMAPWRVGGEYDRPIARRIAEEMGGIPRHFFGQQKLATVTEFPLPPVPVGSRLRQKYFNFLRKHRIAPPWWQWGYKLVHYINSRIIFHSPHRYRYVYYLHRLMSRAAGREIRLPMLYRHIDGRLYCFCVNERAKECERAIKRDTYASEPDGSMRRHRQRLSDRDRTDRR